MRTFINLVNFDTVESLVVQNKIADIIANSQPYTAA